MAHEYRTTVALSRAGFNVISIRKSHKDCEKTPDALIDGQRWEMRAPKASNARVIDRNPRRVLRQSRCIMIDSRRMRDLLDGTVERELQMHAREMRSIERLVFVNHHGEVVGIE